MTFSRRTISLPNTIYSSMPHDGYVHVCGAQSQNFENVDFRIPATNFPTLRFDWWLIRCANTQGRFVWSSDPDETLPTGIIVKLGTCLPRGSAVWNNELTYMWDDGVVP